MAINVGGVGYRVYTSVNTLSQSEKGSEVTVYTYVHIREDIFDIYGFLSTEELSIFEMLISVSGVGPKAALAILSVMSPTALAAAVATNDAKAVARAQGVGTKLAQRIILELKGKISDELFSDFLFDESGGFDREDAAGDAVNALLALGYSPNDARRAVASAGSAATVEETVRQALKKLI